MIKKEVSFFVSPHGFGHATRTLAVIEKLHEYIPELQVKLLTTVPEMLFNNLPVSWSYHKVIVDVGLIQENAFSPDLDRTFEALEGFIPFSQELTENCCQICKSSDLVICDISPLGIHIGNQLGIPSILIENFTWDWIYENLHETEELRSFIPYFHQYYNTATYRIQTEPLCRKINNCITCEPISRSVKTKTEKISATLGNIGREIILITMGGIPHDLPFLTRLTSFKDYLFVVAGQKTYELHADNVLFLPFETTLSHPDLINAASLVICKSGYSTIAECAQTNTSICCINRPGFAESTIIENYVCCHLGGTVLDYQIFHNGSWLDNLPNLLNTRKKTTNKNGAVQVADFVCSILH